VRGRRKHVRSVSCTALHNLEPATVVKTSFDPASHAALNKSKRTPDQSHSSNEMGWRFAHRMACTTRTFELTNNGAGCNVVDIPIDDDIITVHSMVNADR